MIQGHLRRFPLFDSLSDDEVRRMEAVVTAKRVRDGKVLVREGDSAEGPEAAAFLVLDGSVVVLRGGTGRRARTVRELGPGELFGVIALAIDTERSASCRAARPCLIGTFTRGALDALVESDPVLYVKLQAVFGRQLASDTRRLGERLRRASGRGDAGRAR